MGFLRNRRILDCVRQTGRTVHLQPESVAIKVEVSVNGVPIEGTIDERADFDGSIIDDGEMKWRTWAPPDEAQESERRMIIIDSEAECLVRVPEDLAVRIRSLCNAGYSCKATRIDSDEMRHAVDDVAEHLTKGVRQDEQIRKGLATT